MAAARQEAMLYDFRCSRCGLDFEVSRPVTRAAEPAVCPVDGAEAVRVVAMPSAFLKRRAEAPGSSGAVSWSHFGHGHAPGPGAHSHDEPEVDSAGPGERPV